MLPVSYHGKVFLGFRFLKSDRFYLFFLGGGDFCHEKSILGVAVNYSVPLIAVCRYAKSPAKSTH